MATRNSRSKQGTRSTIDHDEIRRFAEERDARPAVVRGTDIIRLDFPGFSGEESLEEIDWDDWFERFDDSNLALIYQEKLRSGQRSNFNKLVGRETIDLGTAKRIALPRRRAKQQRAARGGQAPTSGARTPSRTSSTKSPRAKRGTTGRRGAAGAAKRSTTSSRKKPSQRTQAKSRTRASK